MRASLTCVPDTGQGRTQRESLSPCGCSQGSALSLCRSCTLGSPGVSPTCFTDWPPDPSYQLLSSSPPYWGDGPLCSQCPQRQLCQSCQLKVPAATNAHVGAGASTALGTVGAFCCCCCCPGCLWSPNSAGKQRCLWLDLLSLRPLPRTQQGSRNQARWHAQNSCGPEPGVGTELLPSAMAQLTGGPSAFHGNTPLARLPTLAPSLPTLIDMRGLRTLSVKGRTVNILGFVGHILSLAAAAFSSPGVPPFPFFFIFT